MAKKSGVNDNDKLMGVLAYLGILVIIPIAAGGKSKFVKYHANQGLANLLFAIVIGVGSFILAFIPYLNFILIFAWLIYLVPTIFAILGIINVVNGEEKPLPLIGGITLIK
jgi:uncharacterized membrane protein